MEPRIAGLLTLSVLIGGIVGLDAQEAAVGQPDREGFWIGAGVGAAQSRIDCTPCGPATPNDPWHGGSGFGLYLALGSTVTPQLLLGGELNLYGKRNGEPARDATLWGLAAVIQYYPRLRSGLYLKGGGGLGGSILAGGPGLIESGGLAAQAGAGYDLLLGRRLALAPFATFVQVFSAGAAGRNQGVPAHGPRDPRYLQLGLGFRRH